MKEAIVPLALLAATSAVAAPAAASEPACFIKTSSGQIIDLTKLCAQPSVSINSRSIAPPEVMHTNKMLPIQARFNRLPKPNMREYCSPAKFEHLCDGWVFQVPPDLRYYRSQR